MVGAAKRALRKAGHGKLQLGSQTLLGGSWVVNISGAISKVSILIITHIRGLITPLITTHEPPSSVLNPIAPKPRALKSRNPKRGFGGALTWGLSILWSTILEYFFGVPVPLRNHYEIRVYTLLCLVTSKSSCTSQGFTVTGVFWARAVSEVNRFLALLHLEPPYPENPKPRKP